jgi:hypothetical protein
MSQEETEARDETAVMAITSDAAVGAVGEYGGKAGSTSAPRSWAAEQSSLRITIEPNSLMSY